MSFSLRDHPRFQALPEKYEKPMSDDVLDRLKTALADRYALDRELGRGGMATPLRFATGPNTVIWIGVHS